jgi:membrane protein
VLRSVPKNRLTTTAGGPALFALMAIFPAIATIVSLYGLFSDSHAIVNHVALLAGIVPAGVLDLLTQQILLVAGKQQQYFERSVPDRFPVGVLECKLWS